MEEFRLRGGEGERECANSKPYEFKGNNMNKMVRFKLKHRNSVGFELPNGESRDSNAASAQTGLQCWAGRGWVGRNGEPAGSKSLGRTEGKSAVGQIENARRFSRKSTSN